MGFDGKCKRLLDMITTADSVKGNLLYKTVITIFVNNYYLALPRTYTSSYRLTNITSFFILSRLTGLGITSTTKKISAGDDLCKSFKVS